MSSPSEIIERVKKLLRLARSSNPHEAQLAMQMAMKLANEHRIAIEQLNPDLAGPNITHRDSDPLATLGYDRRLAALIVQRFFRVTTIICPTVVVVHGWPRSGRKVAFVGSASEIEIALYVFEFLVRHFAHCWRKHRGRLRNRYSYVCGIYHGIHTKLAEAEPPAAERQTNGTEIELSMDAYIEEHFGQTFEKGLTSPSASAAFYAGFIRGRQTEIRDAVKSGAECPMLALA